MMEEQDILDEMSADHSGSNQETTTTNDHIIRLPTYVAYLSLGFEVISTLIIIPMAGWIIITIKTTKSLQKISNIFVAHLLVTDAIYVLVRLVFSGTIMIGYFTNNEDFIGCHVYYFFLFPLVVITFMYVTISVDKVIAITFPLRYHQIMKPRVVFGIITTKWVLAIVLFSHNLFNPKGFTKVAKFGVCFPNDRPYIIYISVLFSSLLMIALNIHLTIKAYQLHKQIQEESKLSGDHSTDNDHLKTLKKKQATIKKHRKPMITLMVVALGSASVTLLSTFLLILIRFLRSPVLEDLMRYVVVPNAPFLSFLFHPFVYGLYFKQVREPMMRLLKRITHSCKCKSAAVAP